LANNAGGTVTARHRSVQELPDLVVTDISVNSQNQLTHVRNDARPTLRNFVIQVAANDVVIGDRPIPFADKSCG
jgi:hypothetical protein